MSINNSLRVMLTGVYDVGMTERRSSSYQESFHGGIALNLARAFTRGYNQRLISSKRLPERWLGRTQGTPT
jgi:hypothetical protein